MPRSNEFTIDMIEGIAMFYCPIWKSSQTPEHCNSVLFGNAGSLDVRERCKADCKYVQEIKQFMKDKKNKKKMPTTKEAMKKVDDIINESREGNKMEKQKNETKIHDESKTCQICGKNPVKQSKNRIYKMCHDCWIAKIRKSQSGSKKFNDANKKRRERMKKPYKADTELKPEKQPIANQLSDIMTGTAPYQIIIDFSEDQELFDKIKELAKTDRRNIDQEIMVILEETCFGKDKK